MTSWNFENSFKNFSIELRMRSFYETTTTNTRIFDDCDTETAYYGRLQHCPNLLNILRKKKNWHLISWLFICIKQQTWNYELSAGTICTWLHLCLLVKRLIVMGWIDMFGLSTPYLFSAINMWLSSLRKWSKIYYLMKNTNLHCAHWLEHLMKLVVSYLCENHVRKDIMQVFLFCWKDDYWLYTCWTWIALACIQ